MSRVPPKLEGKRQDSLAGLLTRVAQGDDAGFAEVYDATARTVFGIVFRVLRDHAQAEEVAQEVYLEVWRTAGRYASREGAPAAWINVIAHRKAVDRVRHAERTRLREHRHAQAWAVGPELDAADIALARLGAGSVRAALAKLSAVQRSALELAYLDGYTQQEISDLTGVPLGTVKTRTRDALLRLRRLLVADQISGEVSGGPAACSKSIAQ
jgi:RNA polymerase sigma-70 factor (ECF subfamily)